MLVVCWHGDVDTSENVCLSQSVLFMQFVDFMYVIYTLVVGSKAFV